MLVRFRLGVPESPETEAFQGFFLLLVNMSEPRLLHKTRSNHLVCVDIQEESRLGESSSTQIMGITDVLCRCVHGEARKNDDSLKNLHKQRLQRQFCVEVWVPTISTEVYAIMIAIKNARKIGRAHV